jgi:hypothetical protein
MLPTKTLLGETYVELSPGPRNGPRLPDDGTLPTAPEPATPNKAKSLTDLLNNTLSKPTPNRLDDNRHRENHQLLGHAFPFNPKPPQVKSTIARTITTTATPKPQTQRRQLPPAAG